MSGKGSAQRPRLVSREKFEDNWERIFNKKKREEALDELATISQKQGFYDDIEDVDIAKQN
jgi:hypothetical protein